MGGQRRPKMRYKILASVNKYPRIGFKESVNLGVEKVQLPVKIGLSLTFQGSGYIYYLDYDDGFLSIWL